MAERKLGPNEYPEIVAQRSGKPRWWNFPAELPNGEFRGLENRKDASQVRGALVLGQNIKFRDAGLPNLREGFDPVGTEASNATPISRAWIFKTRNNDVFEIKAYDTGLYYWLKDYSTEYALLKGGFTAGLEFGYGNMGESSGGFYSFFCNGTDPWMEFNGAFATVLSTTVNTITMAESGTFTARGFYTTGTRSVTVAGAERTYTGGEGTTTITGVSSTVGISAGDIIVQTPRAPTFRLFLPFLAASTGEFVIGETVTGAGGTTATVQRVGADKTYVVVTSPSGSFVPGEALTGATSGATSELAAALDQTLGPPLSQIITTHLSRLHCWSSVKKSVWSYSMLDDPFCWTVFSNDTSGGRKDIDFSGPGTAFGSLNQTIIGYKEGSMTALSFIQSGNRVDVPFYTPLVQADDKSTTLGAINQKSTFSSPYGMISVTVDKKMILLTGITNNNQPDYLILSDPIQPLFTRGNHDDSSGIVVDGVLWYSYKSSEDPTANETVLVGDLRRKTVDGYGNVIPLRWDVPYIGWQINDWTAFPNDSGGSAIHWHSSLNSNTYVVTPDSKEDNGGSFSATVRTWNEEFGAPSIRKQADRAFVEIRMRTNSIVDATLLLDEEGYTGRIERTMDGTDTENQFGTQLYNPIGATPIGSQKIGSNGEIDDKITMRYYFELKTTMWFFVMALQLSTEIENSDFELVSFGIHIVNYEPQTPKALAI